MGVSDIYDKDQRKFANKIGKLLNVNVDLYIYDLDNWPEDGEQSMLNLGFSKTIRLSFDRSDKTACYNIIIPVVTLNEKQLEIECYPNGIVLIYFLTFNHTWVGFISDLKGLNDQYYSSRQTCVDEWLILRNAYSSVLKGLNCYNLIVYADYRYRFESTLPFEKKPVKDIDEILTWLKRYDHLTVFELKEVIMKYKSHILALPENIREDKIVFHDHFIPG